MLFGGPLKKSNYDFIEAFFLASVLCCLIEMGESFSHSVLKMLPHEKSTRAIEFA